VKFGSGPAAVTGDESQNATGCWPGRQISRKNREPEDLPVNDFANSFPGTGRLGMKLNRVQSSGLYSSGDFLLTRKMQLYAGIISAEVQKSNYGKIYSL
jgi:hypothetical protein